MDPGTEVCSGKDDSSKVDVNPGRDKDSKPNELVCSVAVLEPETTLVTGGMPVEIPSPTLEEAALDENGISVLWVSEGSKLKNDVVEKLVMNPEDWADENDAKLYSYDERTAEIEL